jgi:hypothetical protein
MPHKWLDKEKTQISYKPDWKPGILWGQELGKPECPYLKRWVLNFGKFSIRLHHWIGSDDPRYMHDHAWGFYTLVLKGGYTDVTGAPMHEGNKCPYCDANSAWPYDCSVCQRSIRTNYQHLKAGSFTYRPAHHKHTVQTDPGGAWTLLLVGPFKRKWGFYVDGKFVGVRQYFREFGHHPCIDDLSDVDATLDEQKVQ